jgi:hypothetical protein
MFRMSLANQRTYPCMRIMQMQAFLTSVYSARRPVIAERGILHYERVDTAAELVKEGRILAATADLLYCTVRLSRSSPSFGPTHSILGMQNACVHMGSGGFHNTFLLVIVITPLVRLQW